MNMKYVNYHYYYPNWCLKGTLITILALIKVKLIIIITNYNNITWIVLNLVTLDKD